MYRTGQRLMLYFAMMSATWFVSECFRYTILDTEERSRADAFNGCENQHQSLPVIKSETENTELREFLKSNEINGEVWLGLKPLSWSTNAAEFTWTDNFVISWSDWGDGADKLNEQKCAVADVDYKWYTRNCADRYRFVCQAKEKTSDKKQAPGTLWSGCFTRLRGIKPNSPPGTIFKSSSPLHCAAACLAQGDCDVIILNSAGSCFLYPTTISLLQSDSTSGDRIYQKTNSVICNPE